MRQLPKNEERRPSLLETLLRRIRGFRRGDSDNGGLRETLEDLLEEETDDSTEQLTAEERELLLNALSFSELRVDDVMVPRSDIKAVDVGITLVELVRAFSDGGHSRLIVYRGKLDDVAGIVHIRDILPFWGDGETFELAAVTRKVMVVPPSMRVLDMLLEMRDTRTHMAVVVDEFGGTDGLVTVEDLVQEILGEMHDEHAPEESGQFVDAADGSFEADARLDIDELEERLGLSLLEDDDRDEVDTIAGVIFTLVDRVPEAGETVEHPAGPVFEILEADPRRIRRVRVIPGPSPAAADTGSDADG
ncbi:MAG: HlyC/CorC family transporter [Geminicoccaceae bacterium]|nr:HlyC/CorC family transporter [Geminicoccaceae bacterium]